MEVIVSTTRRIGFLIDSGVARLNRFSKDIRTFVFRVGGAYGQIDEGPMPMRDFGGIRRNNLAATQHTMKPPAPSVGAGTGGQKGLVAELVLSHPQFVCGSRVGTRPAVSRTALVRLRARTEQKLTPKTRNFGLDILRAAAITMVFFAHGLVGTRFEPRIGPFGGSGVDLFFVLSGFLIGRIYFRDSSGGSFSFWRFWRSRWWRTLPPYVGGMIVYLIVQELTFEWLHLPGLGFRYVVFLQNYLGAVTGFAQSWSLCVEEHFYLLLPIVAFLIGRLFGRKTFAVILPIAFFVPLVLRVAMFLALGRLPYEWYWMTHFRCDGLIAGVWLAYLFVDHRRTFDVLKKPSACLLPLVPIILALGPRWYARESDVNFYIVGFSLVALGWAAWVRFLYDLRWQPQKWASRLIQISIRGLALCSYSIYLTHSALFILFGSLGFILALPHDLGILAKFVATLLFGGAFYFLVERPAIVTRDRFLGNERS